MPFKTEMSCFAFTVDRNLMDFFCNMNETEKTMFAGTVHRLETKLAPGCGRTAPCPIEIELKV